ncbi:MAG TPA: flagellar hook-length control protein FliK, partial [Candidatus Marinimicrobia bacterium]|nr:flagellar hook-length control protein FliK [Candidatus Neomarinimicrobiota bacterium]
FTQFLKGTELKGRVSETLMKKFGDTYIDSNLHQSSKKLETDKFQGENELKDEVKSDKHQTSDREKSNQLEEKSTPKKLNSRPNPIFRNEQKGSLNLKSVSDLDFKSSNIQMSRGNTLFQSSLQSIQNVNKVQLTTKITQIIHGNFSSNGSKSAIYKIDGGQLGNLEIKLTQRDTMTKATVVVESDAVKPIMEKIVTDIKENLNEKGMRFESFNVEVGADKKNFNGGKRFSQNIFHEIEDEEISNSDQIALRQFGYNTIEVIA